MNGKTEIMERLIRNINHEIKNPLTVIRGYAQLLTMKVSDEEFQKKTGRLIMENVDLIDARISAMYKAFAQVSGERCTVDIVQELHHIVQSYREEFRTRIEICGKSPCEASINREAFHRVVDCLQRGFNWKANPHVTALIDVGVSEGQITLLFEYRNADFSNLPHKWFYLPFSEKTNFTIGTEIFEAYCLAAANGWVFDLLKESGKNGFIVRI